MDKSQSTPEETINYNDAPVIYCKHCLSLAIKSIDVYNYCDQCGSTNLKIAHIEEWEEIYRQKYGVDHLKK